MVLLLFRIHAHTQRWGERVSKSVISQIYVNNYVYCIMVIDKRQKVLHSHTQRKFIAKTKQVWNLKLWNKMPLLYYILYSRYSHIICTCVCALLYVSQLLLKVWHCRAVLLNTGRTQKTWKKPIESRAVCVTTVDSHTHTHTGTHSRMPIRFKSHKDIE